MLSAAEDAITSLKHELKAKLFKLPKKVSLENSVVNLRSRPEECA